MGLFPGLDCIIDNKGPLLIGLIIIVVGTTTCSRRRTRVKEAKMLPRSFIQTEELSLLTSVFRLTCFGGIEKGANSKLGIATGIAAGNFFRLS